VVSGMSVVSVVSVGFMIDLCVGVFLKIFNARVSARGETLFRVPDEDDAVQVGGLLDWIRSSEGGRVGQAGKREEYDRSEQDHSFHFESWGVLRHRCNQKEETGGDLQVAEKSGSIYTRS
jgi:hypothetical protein